MHPVRREWGELRPPLSPLKAARPGVRHRCRTCASGEDLGNRVVCRVWGIEIWEPDEPRYCRTWESRGQARL